MRFVFTIPQTLVDDIDRHRGDVPRAAWVRRACEDKLGTALVGVVEPPFIPAEHGWDAGVVQDVGATIAEAAFAAADPSHCDHPKKQRRPLGYTTLCGICGEKVR